jgi:multiple sugar transport system substrate-binding protein
MKKNIKRTLLLALAAFMIIGLIAACAEPAADDPPAAQEEAPPPPPPEAPPPPAPEGGDDENDADIIEITYMFWGDEAEVANVTALAEEFNALNPHIRVVPVPVDRAEIAAILTTLAAAGELPDTGFMTEPLTIPWAQAGFIEAPTFVGETPRDLISFVWEGEAVAYSSCTVQLTMFYDIDRFDDAGIARPPKTAADAWTWDEFLDVAKSLTFDVNGNDAHSPNFDRNNVEMYAFYLEPAVWQLETWAISNGGGFFNPDDWSDVIINSPESAEAIQRIADLYLVHGVMPRYATWPADSIDSWFLEENIAMAINGSWSIGVWMSPARDEHGLNYSVAVMPNMGRVTTLGTAGLVVQYYGSEHPEAAAEWLAWFVDNSSFLIDIGIWMPRYQSMFTDESLMGWAQTPAFPPFEDFRTAVIDVSVNNAVSAAWHWVPNMEPFLEELSSVLAPVWAGDQTAQEALDAAHATLTAIIRG